MPSFLKKNKKITILLLLISFQMILISIQVPKGEEGTYFERFIFTVFSSLQNGVISLSRSVSKVWNDYLYLRRVNLQNRRLNREVTQLRQENIVLRNMLKKYEKESEVKDFLNHISKDLVTARIIGFDMSNVYKSIVINKGSQQGIKKDMVVLDERGHLVGRVVNPIAFSQATVQLITDSSSGVSIKKQNGTSIGILSGNNTGICEMKYILSTDEEIIPDDVIVTTGHDGIFIPSLKVGEVLSVKRTHELFKEIKVTPYFNVSQLHLVVVVRISTNEVF
jgi:rod shape-determining protein MreC